MIFKLNEIFKKDFVVSKDTYEGFVHLFNDRNPLHISEDFALDKGFKGKVMHGNILNGFISYFIGECLPTKNVIIHSQEIKFLNPVYLNDELQLMVMVVGIYDSVKAIQFKFSFKNSALKIVASGKVQIGLFT